MIAEATTQNIEKACAILRGDGVIGLPTETVYGLAGNALSDTAVRRIYTIKNRPEFNPLIIHYAQPPVIDYEVYKTLAHAFWPGPLTLIIPQEMVRDKISSYATAGLDTVAIRMPSHPVAQSVLRKVKCPLAAPSANRSGSLSPTTPAHVATSLGNDVDMILAAGRSMIGLESTVIDITSQTPVLLRHGAITPEDIRERTNIDVLYSDKDAKIKSPGQLLKHYAPKTPIRLNAIDVHKDEALLAFGSTKFMAIKSGGNVTNLPDNRIANLSETGDLNEAAHNLFNMLHTLDTAGAERIAVMAIPDTGLGIAINDRLTRAAQS